jgi:quinol-cytochrome oxidoreductase complex cytochrome b subunit
VAYENMLNLLSNVPFGQLMRDLHRLAAELMVIVVVLHMLRTFVTGSYKKPRQFTWATGVILLFVTLVLSFSGYLLPWDQLSLWAVTIGASMVEAIRAGDRRPQRQPAGAGAPGSAPTGSALLPAARRSPLAGISPSAVHYYKVIHHGTACRRREKVGQDTAKRVPMDKRVYFMPEIATRELWYVAGLLAVLFAAAAYLYNAPALEPHANPLITPLHTTAPWYFLWLQGMLKIGDKVIWGLVIPGVLTGLLLLLPYLEVGPSRRYGDRRIGLSLAALFVAAMAILSYMGTPHYAVSTSPDQEAVAELLPQTHPGPLRSTVGRSAFRQL